MINESLSLSLSHFARFYQPAGIGGRQAQLCGCCLRRKCSELDVDCVSGAAAMFAGVVQATRAGLLLLLCY